MNANRGYIGWSESVRSAKAKSNGEFPKTLFKKQYKLTEKKFQEYLKDGLIVKSSWHHTSKYFNKTDFYSFTNDGLFFMDLISYETYMELELLFQEEIKTIRFSFEYQFNKKRFDSFVFENHLYEIHQTIKGVDIWTGENDKVVRMLVDTFETKTGKVGQIVQVHNKNYSFQF